MIPPKQIAILNALANYKFLSRSQLARLGVEKYNSAFSRYCKPLIDAKYIGLLNAVNYGIGHIYYLKKKGALFVAKENNLTIDQIKYCISTPELSLQTLYHRTHAIDCQIELDLSCINKAVELLFYDREIESLGNIRRDKNLSRRTRVLLKNNEILEPDAIFMLKTQFGNKLYCLEYEHKDYTQKSYSKLLKHLRALNEKVVSSKYGHTKGHRTLFIYNNRATLEAVMSKAKIEIKNIESWFLFKSFEEVKFEGGFNNSIFECTAFNCFFENWRTAENEITSLF